MIASEIAYAFSSRLDGADKRRLIVDLLRSGNNLLVLLEKQVVLQRFADCASETRTQRCWPSTSAMFVTALWWVHAEPAPGLAMHIWAPSTEY